MVDVISDYLTSPHEAVRCTIQSQKNEQLIKQLEVLEKLPGARGGKASDKDNVDRQILDLKRYKRYLEEGIDEANKHDV